MSGTLNRVLLVGNVGRDPEVRTTQDGRKIVSLSLATSESWKGKDGLKKERTDWHNVVILAEGLAGIAENYVRKGSKLAVEGSLQTRKWQDKSGADRYATEVIVGVRHGTITLLDVATNGQKTVRDVAREAQAPWGEEFN